MKRNETSKFQAPSTREAPSSIHQSYRAKVLELGGWNFSGAWMLVLGAFVGALSVSVFGATNEVAEVLPPCCRPIAAQTNYIDKSLFLLDRKRTRLNSSHLGISYAVFCLKKQ